MGWARERWQSQGCSGLLILLTCAACVTCDEQAQLGGGFGTVQLSFVLPHPPPASAVSLPPLQSHKSAAAVGSYSLPPIPAGTAQQENDAARQPAAAPAIQPTIQLTMQPTQKPTNVAAPNLATHPAKGAEAVGKPVVQPATGAGTSGQLGTAANPGDTDAYEESEEPETDSSNYGSDLEADSPGEGPNVAGTRPATPAKRPEAATSSSNSSSTALKPGTIPVTPLLPARATTAPQVAIGTGSAAVAGNTASTDVSTSGTAGTGSPGSLSAAIISPKAPPKALHPQPLQPAATAGSTSSSSSSGHAAFGPSHSTKPTVPTPAAGTPLPVSSLAANVVASPPPFVFTQKGATKTIKIGCALPFEGLQKVIGESVLAALKMAVTDFAPKETPGVNVNLTCINSKCIDIPTYQAVNKFATEGVVAVIGELCSGASVAAAGVANSKKIPIISPASTSPSLSDIDHFFRTVPSDRYQGVAAANLAYGSGARNVGLIYQDSSYGYGLAFNFIAGFTKNGGSVPVVYQFKPGQGDPKVAVEQMKPGKQQKTLDAVFISTNNLTFVADFLVAAKAADLGLPLFGGDALADITLYRYVQGRQSAIANLSATTLAPGTPEFIEKFRQTNPGVTYSTFASHAYDAMNALLKAYKAAAPPKSGTRIVAQLQHQNFAGASGPIAFDTFGDLVPDNKSYIWIRFNATTGAVIIKGFISR